MVHDIKSGYGPIKPCFSQSEGCVICRFATMIFPLHEKKENLPTYTHIYPKYIFIQK